MEIKYGILLSILISVSSCVILQNNKEKEITITGNVSATEYLIPVPSRLQFYIENELIKEVNSDNNGLYSIDIQRKYLHEKCTIIVQPLQKTVKKNITIGNGISTEGYAQDLKTDTIVRILNDTILNIELTKFLLIELETRLSH